MILVCAAACSDEAVPAWAPHGDADAAVDPSSDSIPVKPSKPMSDGINEPTAGSRADDEAEASADAGEAPGAAGSSAPTFGTNCSAAQLAGKNGFCYTTSNPLASRHLVQEGANVGEGTIRFYPRSGSDDVIIELDDPTRHRAFMVVFPMPGPGHWIPQKVHVPAIFSGEDGIGSVERFCDDEVETEIDISELVFRRNGWLGRASVTANASCPSGAGDISARFHIEHESDEYLVADEPCSVGADNGYCFISEIGGYNQGNPRVRRDGELMLDGEYAPPNLTITASNDEDIPSIFTMGFAATLPKGIEVETKYTASVSYLEAIPSGASKVGLSIPTQADCTTSSGTFTVHELVLHDVNPNYVIKASVDFEHTCDGRTLSGQVRLDATGE
jgi:hypothetical protein